MAFKFCLSECRHAPSPCTAGRRKRNEFPPLGGARQQLLWALSDTRRPSMAQHWASPMSAPRSPLFSPPLASSACLLLAPPVHVVSPGHGRRPLGWRSVAGRSAGTSSLPSLPALLLSPILGNWRFSPLACARGARRRPGDRDRSTSGPRCPGLVSSAVSWPACPRREKVLGRGGTFLHHQLQVALLLLLICWRVLAPNAL